MNARPVFAAALPLVLAACSAISATDEGDTSADVDATSSDVIHVFDDSGDDFADDVAGDPDEDPAGDAESNLAADTAEPDVADDAEDTLPADTAEDGGGDVLADAPEDASADTASDVGPPGPRAVAPPEPPEVSDRVRRVSVALRTATSSNAETDSSAELCVGGTCLRMDTPDVNDRESGNVEVHHFADLDLALAALDSITIGTPSTDPDNDRWTPACVEVSFDGRPVYCQDEIPVHIGTGSSANEVRSWTDPAGLATTCVTCQRGVLTHGPMIGASAPDRVRVWGRTHATRLVGLRLGTSADLRDAPVVAWSYPAPADDFTFSLQADGLASDTEYFYRVEVDGEPQGPVRPMRTAPTPDAEPPVRLAFGSCSRLLDQPVFTALLADRPRAFLFIGDNNYANSRYRDALRWHYRRFRELEPRAEFVANTESLAIWDDHDFLANNSNAMCPGRDEALAAFAEYWSNPAYGLPDTPGVFFTQRWGAVELFALDCRMYRPDVGDSGRTCTPDAGTPNPPRSDGPLGPAQEGWLLDALGASDATFKLLACGSRFTPAGSTDSWRSFPEAAARLWGEIDERGIGGVVLLSGDIHRSEFRWVDAPGYRMPEITSSPLATGPSSCPASGPLACYDADNSYVLLDIDPTLDDPTLTATMKREDGSVVTEWTIRRSELEP